jgi:hypothetical protein
MSSEECKQFVIKFLEKASALTSPNAEQFIDAFYAPGYICHNYDPEGLEMDLPSMRKALIQWGQDLDDLHFFVDDSLAEGDKVAIRGHAIAKSKAGEPRNWNFFAIERIAGDQLAEEWQIFIQVPAGKKAAS